MSDNLACIGFDIHQSVYIVNLSYGKPTHSLDRVSVPSPIAIDMLMDKMARDRAHMYLFSV